MEETHKVAGKCPATATALENAFQKAARERNSSLSKGLCPGGFTWRCLKVVGRFIKEALPDGGHLPEHNWVRRHAAILVLAWVQVLFIPFFGVVLGKSVGHSINEALIVAGPALFATWPFTNRKFRACAATFSLLSASAVLTHLSGGSIEMHFHFFVMLAVISLYQEWTSFLLAIGFVLAHHGIGGVLDPASVYNHAAGQAHPWKWAAIHAFFVSGSCLVSVVAWKFNERAREEAEESFRQLYEGEKAIVTELMETQQAKEELLSIVSHEFRTPVTSIYGFAKLLTTKGDGLSAEDKQDMKERIMIQAERLKLMVENLLSAARPINPELGSQTNVLGSVDSVVNQLSEQLPKKGMWFDIEVPAHLEAGMGPEALQLILMNLMSNAVKYGDANSPVVVSATNGQVLDSNPSVQAVQLSIRNNTSPISVAERERMFEPFVQLDSSSTRTGGGVGLGLHIVRRVLDACDGDVEVAGDDASITFNVRIPAAPAHAVAS